jgi:pyridoxal phosphate enzyme (YggS family)
VIDRERLKRNLDEVKAAITASCNRSGRSPESVQLLAVTKTVDAETVNALGDLGQHRFGENRAHVGVPKVDAVTVPESEWHFIGHLQRRKVKSILPAFRWIHSVDSIRLADEIQRCAAQLNITVNVLLEAKMSEEESKLGATPTEVMELAQHTADLPNLQLQGLMTMAPFFPEAEACRPYFRRLAELQRTIESDLSLQLPELSMGMSNDYPVAIEEGATLVRVGTALFEGILPSVQEAS